MSAEEIIYSLYPRKVGKPVALRSIRKAILKFGYEHLRWRVEEFAAITKDKDMQFIPYPSTFFNQERFNDDLEAVFPRPKINGQKILSIMDLRAVISAKQNEVDELKFNHSHDHALGTEWSDQKARKRCREIRQEIATLNTQLANRA